MDILFVCTGNICRSPMAEAILGRRLAQLGVPAHVHSAGLLDEGVPAPEVSVAALAARGLHIGDHRSRVLSRSMLEAADLVIGLARYHVREAVAMVPRVWPISFTLKEIVRRGEAAGPRGEESLADWLARVHADRQPTDLVGESDRDDVFDPIGCSRGVYDATAAEIDDLVNRLVDLAFASSPSPIRSKTR